MKHAHVVDEPQELEEVRGVLLDALVVEQLGNGDVRIGVEVVRVVFLILADGLYHLEDLALDLLRL